jgi:hypothetical protein
MPNRLREPSRHPLLATRTAAHRLPPNARTSLHLVMGGRRLAVGPP